MQTHAILIANDSYPDLDGGVGNRHINVPKVVVGELQRRQIAVNCVLRYVRSVSI